MHSSIGLWSILLTSLLVLVSCSAGRLQAPQGGQQALMPVNPPYPGPFKTVEVAGIEMLQARGKPVTPGGTLVRSLVGSDPKVFNPWTSSDTQSSELAGLMFGGLVGIDPYDGLLYPYMASKVEVDPDGRTYTTTLRQGLTWSDGKPITSEDVAFTWNTIIAGGYGNSSLRDVTTIDGKSPTVTVIDELTNRFVTPRPFAPFKRLLSISIAPKHIIEPIIKSKDGRKRFQELWSARAETAGQIVTSGPFRLSRYVPAQRVEFVRTDNYFMVDKKGHSLPNLEKITYVIVPEVNTNLLKFRAREIDITQVRNRDVVDLMQVAGAENFKLYNLGQGIGTTFVMFNMNRRKNPDTGKPYVNPLKSRWFNDVNFRLAVNHALDRQAMVDNYFKGIGFRLFTAEPPSSPYFNKSLKPFAPDLNYSLSLLAKSGFKKQADGLLHDADGNKVEFDLLSASGGTFSETVGNMIVDDLKKLGMKVNFQLIDFNILTSKVGHSLTWEACMMGLSSGDPLEPNDGANVYKVNGRLHLFDQRLPDKKGEILVEDARPWERQLTEIFNRGAETLDAEKRRQLYNQYQQIVYDQAPFIFLVSPMVIVGARNTIGNYTPTQLSQSILGLHNLEEIDKR